MIESKVDRIKNNVNRTAKTGKTSSREKIIMAEKRSIVLNKYKRNIFKIVALLLVLCTILVYVNSNKNGKIDENSNIAKLDANKYSTEILTLYNRDSQVNKFLIEMDRVQNLIGKYVISNSTLQEDSFSQLVKSLNNELNNDKWVKLDSQKTNYYKGKYTIDDNGNLKFKFDNKKIEPNWINNESISKYITLN